MFADPELPWKSVSPKLLLVRRIPVAVFALLCVVAVVVVPMTAPAVWVLIPVGGLLAAALSWYWVGRIVTSWRYAELPDELLVSHGRLFRRLSVVPYGRMQVVDVDAGPVANYFGIATVQLVTASASTDARIPGLPADVAHELRSRLTARGEAQAAGL